jgi:predicted RNA-binding protein with RPS1 domain
VPGLGEKRFTQAAGFLKLPESSEPLDGTWIHPESYPLARQVLAELGFSPADLRDRAKLDELRAKLNVTNPAEVATKFSAGEPTVRDIFDAVARPGRDPREDLPPPIFKTGVLKIEDISPGMELKGTVLNVVPFGAFVDIGLKESGLVHISQMANRYIKSPYDVVSVGDVITVWVMEVKAGEKKISLSMIPPGQERRPPERGGRFAGGPPQRGDRAQGPPQGVPPQQIDQRDRPPMPPRGGERPGFQPRGDRPGFQPRGGGFQRGGQGGRFGTRGPGSPGGPPQPGIAGPAPAGEVPATTGTQGQAPAPIQPPPPRKQGKPKPLPNLSAEKKSGKAALNTFAELAAFFKPPEPEKPKEEPKPEEPKRAEPSAEAPPEQPKPDLTPEPVSEVKPEEPKPEEPKPEEPKSDEPKPEGTS